ncbi:hypothetical protein [Prevotella sp. SGI.167]|uniref:hypothetical protein n=1 Tax=Prevotella sp. SGI.167 TaxID=3420566 RepID=UPI004040978D
MKKVKFFGLAGIILLASGAGFSSCSSDSADSTGGIGVAGQVVKTQFYLNIPYAGNEKGGNARVSTRMSDVNTQHNNNFLGLQDMQMYAFEGEAAGITSTSTKSITLGTSGNAPSKDDISTSTTSWRSIYRDIEIPLRTKSLILYAKASRATTTGSSNTKNEFQAGSLTNPYETPNDVTTLSSLNFSLNQIYKTDNFTSDGSVILEALNTVAQTKITPTEGTELEWANVGTSNIGTANERDALQERYNNFISATAGSANSVRLLITDLKNVITGSGLENDQAMANQIVTNCKTALDKLTSKTFPRDLNLPDGVAQVRWDGNSKEFNFVAATGVSVGTTVANTGNNINFTEITYPAELAYFVSSPVKTSENEITAASKLPSYQDWVSDTYTWEGYDDEVKHRTRFVALKKPLQYGVACLQSKVSCKTAALADNAQKFGFKTDNTINVNSTKDFKVTGILIGGQPLSVAWNFEPASTVNTNDFKYTIYDQHVDYGNNVNTTGTSNNYTLVFDNKDAHNNSKVYVTIELENKVENFYGAEGLIPIGSKFYLVGELDPSNTTTASKPTGEAIDRVFVKDHTTFANFTINDLKNAYNHIPDMRTSKINVGLAVDLSWKAGIEFNVEL